MEKEEIMLDKETPEEGRESQGDLNKQNELLNLLNDLDQLGSEISEENKKKLVNVQKMINSKKMCFYTATCSYQEVVFIICILHHYIDSMESYKDDIWWSYYYDVFVKLANRLAMQIDYDYEKSKEKCLKKSNIGGDALEIMIEREMAKSDQSLTGKEDA